MPSAVDLMVKEPRCSRAVVLVASRRGRVTELRLKQEASSPVPMRKGRMSPSFPSWSPSLRMSAVESLAELRWTAVVVSIQNAKPPEPLA